MATATGLSAGAPATVPTENGGEQPTQNDGTPQVALSEEDWESERKIVGALAVLQELEAKVHNP
jgi:hypothetical protein